MFLQAGGKRMISLTDWCFLAPVPFADRSRGSLFVMARTVPICFLTINP
jgi:hypothetical protein